MAHDVFISHSSHDRQIAETVCAALEAKGIRCWTAPRDVRPGAPYAEAIIDAIHGCRVMVLVLSSHSNASPHVHKEVERAANDRATIIPLRVENVLPSKSLEFFISPVQWLDATALPLDSHLENLAKTIRRIVQENEPLLPLQPAPHPLLPEVSKEGAIEAGKSIFGSRWLYIGGGPVILVIVLLAWLSRREEGGFFHAVSPPISIAVVPFHTVEAAEKKEIESFRIAIPEEIRTELANFRVRLPGIEDALAYQNQGLGDEEIGHKLNTRYILRGTIREGSNGIAMDVQLLRVNDGTSLLGRHYDTGSSKFPSLQRNITNEVTGVLKIARSGADQARASRRHTENEDAYKLYLDGRTLLVRHTEEGIRNAADAFEKAVQLDPNYALAYAGLAMASAEMPSRFAGRGELKQWTERAKEAAKRALELDNSLAEAHQALAAVYRKSEYNWDGTIAESRRALELDPNLDQPHYYRASALYHLGLLDMVENDVRAALDINSEDQVEAQRNRGVTALLAGHYSDAVRFLEQVQRMSARPQSDLWLARAYYYLGDVDRAEKMLDDLRSSSSASSAARSTAALAGFLAKNDPVRAQTLLRAVAPGGCEQASKAPYMDHHVAHSLGSAYAQLSDTKEAVCWLRLAADTGFPCYPWYATDPLLEPVRRDPDFRAFLSDQRKAWALTKARYAN